MRDGMMPDRCVMALCRIVRLLDLCVWSKRRRDGMMPDRLDLRAMCDDSSLTAALESSLESVRGRSPTADPNGEHVATRQ